MKAWFTPVVQVVLLGVLLVPGLSAVPVKGQAILCVSLSSQTSAGAISARSARTDWVAVRVGDTIPADAELRVAADRDWAEFTPSTDPNTVFWLEGSETGQVVKKVADVLKSKFRVVKFPKVGKGADPEFKDKLVVKHLVGRQVYRANADTPDKDIRYGDVLELKGRVRIIGIHSTLTLVFPNGVTTTVVGPLSFDVQKVFSGSNLYKYLNVK